MTIRSSHAILFAIIIFQWCLLALFLNVLPVQDGSDIATTMMSSNQLCTCGKDTKDTKVPQNDTLPWKGVAVGLMLKRPRWFYKRYNIMLHNALSNIPLDWGLQLFVNHDWFSNELLEYHRGIRRLIDKHPRVLITELPSNLERLKPNGLLKEPWLWNRAVADRVLILHGDGTLCSNTFRYWNDFDHLDYVGVPWSNFDGVGGDGTTFSLRSRTAVLEALSSNLGSGASESVHLVSALLKLNQKGSNYRLATPQETYWFGGTMHLMDNDTVLDPRANPGDFGPMVLSGTQAALSDEAREVVISVCPEIKAIYPSLHNPSCFGARPDLVKCAAFLKMDAPLCEPAQ